MRARWSPARRSTVAARGRISRWRPAADRRRTSRRRAAPRGPGLAASSAWGSAWRSVRGRDEPAELVFVEDAQAERLRLRQLAAAGGAGDDVGDLLADRA